MIIALPLLFAAFTPIRDPDMLVPMHWPTDQVTVVLQRDGSDDVSDDTDLAALRDAMAVWSTVACTSFRFVDGGTNASRAIAQDGVNRITFLESNWPGGADGAGAFTVRYRDTSTSPDRFIEFDIRINGEQYQWATDASPGRIDIQGVVVHELGHAIGLSHTASPEATMYFFNSPELTHARTLHADDRRGVCFLYPMGGTFRCGANADCPLYDGLFGGASERLGCNASSACEIRGVGFGDGCFGGAHCTSGQCVGDPLGTPGGDPGYCSNSCALGGTDCAPESVCFDPGNGPFCYLGRDDCSRDEDCTGNNVACRRDLDGRYRCLRFCLMDEHCMSVPGTICHHGTGMNPPGWCRTPGPKLGGEECEHSLECETLACARPGVMPSCTGAIPQIDAGFADAMSFPDALMPPAPDAMIPDPIDAAPVEPADAAEPVPASSTSGCSCSSVHSDSR